MSFCVIIITRFIQKKRRFISLSLSQTLREEEEKERLESVRVRVTFVRAAVWARARAGVLKRKK